MVRKKGTTYLAPSPVCLKVLVLVFLGPAGISWPKPSRDQEYQVDGLTPSYLVFWWTGQPPVHGLVTALLWRHHSLHSLQRYSMKVVLLSTFQTHLFIVRLWLFLVTFYGCVGLVCILL